jgi:hypothetical protein
MHCTREKSGLCHTPFLTWATALAGKARIQGKVEEGRVKRRVKRRVKGAYLRLLVEVKWAVGYLGHNCHPRRRYLSYLTSYLSYLTSFTTHLILSISPLPSSAPPAPRFKHTLSSKIAERLVTN